MTSGILSQGAVLHGVRVLELGHFVAAPFCTRLLADLGADVIKVEARDGDPVRAWGEQLDGHSLWWSIHGRNKRSVAIDLKSEAGRELVLRLVGKCDVVVENFRPGQLKRLGLGESVMRRIKPDLIVAQISGYGQTGPSRDKAAFGVIGEAIGGLRHLTDQPPGTSDLPPVRVGISIGDSIAGLYAAFGIAAALWQRDRAGGDALGRTLDVALTESVLSMMEEMLPVYGALGKEKQPTGGGIATAAPSNAYPTRDGDFIIIAANSDPLFAKLARLIGRDELVGAPGFAGNRARVARAAELDGIIADWTRIRGTTELLGLLSAADIPSCKIYTAADCATDPQYLARGMVREVHDPVLGRAVLHSGVVPHFPGSPDPIRWTGPAVGAHGDDVMRDVLGLDDVELEALRAKGVL